jgi:hypothetical protein
MGRILGQLVPRGGGDPIPLLKNELSIGRRSSCDISLDFSNISGRHCQLILSHGYWYLRDLNSSNGTKVNGVKIMERRVDPGAFVSIAKHEYELVYDPAVNGAVGPPPPDHLDTDIFSKSLLERAGLQRGDLRKVTPHRESYEDRTYDVLDDSGEPMKRKGH